MKYILTNLGRETFSNPTNGENLRHLCLIMASKGNKPLTLEQISSFMLVHSELCEFQAFDDDKNADILRVTAQYYRDFEGYVDEILDMAIRLGFVQQVK